jgi:hypothetical protein
VPRISASIMRSLPKEICALRLSPTTCAFVTTVPCASIRKPVPWPPEPPARTETTAGDAAA